MRIPTLVVLSLLSAVGVGGAAEARAQEPVSENVRLVFQVVEADGFEETDPAIAAVVEELRRLFRFEGYRLLDTSVLHGTLCRRSAPVCREAGESMGPVRQRLALAGHGTLIIEAWLRATAEPDLVRTSIYLRDGDREQLVGNGMWRAPELLNASVNVRNGQTVVLGSVRDDPEGGAIILVMRAEFSPEAGPRP